MPAKITSDQAKKLAKAVARGEVNRKPIALQLGRDLIDEFTFEASSYGFVERSKEAIKGKIGLGGKDKESEE